MSRLARSSLLIHTALLASGYSAVRPMASYRAIELGADGVVLGVLAASFSALPLLVAFHAGRLIDRHGPFGAVLLGNVLLVVAGTVAMLAHELRLLLLAAACLGLGHVFCMLGQQATAAASARRDRAFGHLSSAAAAGQIAGPLMMTAAAAAAPLLGASEAVGGLAASLLVCVLALPPAGWMSQGALRTSPAQREPSWGAAMRIVRMRGAWQAFLAGGAVVAATDLLLAYLPLWAHERGVATGAVGALLALRSGVTLVSRIGIQSLVGRLGRRRVVAGSLLAASVGLSLLPFVGLSGAIVLMVVLGFGLGVAQPLTMAWLTDITPPGTRAAALGIRLTANRASQVVVPATIGLVAAGSGASGVFWALSGVLLSSCAVMARAPMESAGGAAL